MTEEFLRENVIHSQGTPMISSIRGTCGSRLLSEVRPKVPRSHAVNVTNCLSAPACSVRLRVELDKTHVEHNKSALP